MCFATATFGTIVPTASGDSVASPAGGATAGVKVRAASSRPRQRLSRSYPIQPPSRSGLESRVVVGKRVVEDTDVVETDVRKERFEVENETSTPADADRKRPPRGSGR